METVKQARVSDSGNISLPLIGGLKVSGLTVQEVETAAQKSYRTAGLIASTRTLRIVNPSGRTVSSPSVHYYILKPTSGQAITGKNFATV